MADNITFVIERMKEKDEKMVTIPGKNRFD